MSSYRQDLIKAIMERDPAARSSIEVRLLYPGYKAIMSHCRANWCFRHNFKFLLQCEHSAGEGDTRHAGRGQIHRHCAILPRKRA